MCVRARACDGVLMVHKRCMTVSFVDADLSLSPATSYLKLLLSVPKTCSGEEGRRPAAEPFRS